MKGVECDLVVASRAVSAGPALLVLFGDVHDAGASVG